MNIIILMNIEQFAELWGKEKRTPIGVNKVRALVAHIVEEFHPT